MSKCFLHPECALNCYWICTECSLNVFSVQGRIVEIGTHSELLAKPAQSRMGDENITTYRTLVARQTLLK
jgi:hypothetical protein